MAVRKIGRSVSLGALALAAFLVPSLAQAQEDGRERGWRARTEAQAARAESRAASDDNQRGGAGWNRPLPQRAAPQAQQSSQPGGSQGRGNWAGHAQQPQAAPQPQAPRAQWNGGGDRQEWRRGRDNDDRSDERRHDTNRRPAWNGTPQPGTTAPVQPAPPRQTWTGSGRNDQHDGDRDRWRRDSRDGDWNRDGRHDRDGDRWRDASRDGSRYRGEGWRNPSRGERYHGDYRSWDRKWRNNNRYNWHWYRDRNRHVYHMPYYYAPYRNYSYRRLSIGFFLDSLFFSSRYWINDPWRYRLPDAYGPYRWVRYYDDALLVDIYSGEVVDVIHNFFW